MKKKILEEMGACHPLRITWYNKRGHHQLKVLGQPMVAKAVGKIQPSPLPASWNRLLFRLADRLARPKSTSPGQAEQSQVSVWWDRPFDKSAGMARIWWHRRTIMSEWWPHRFPRSSEHPASCISLA